MEEIKPFLAFVERIVGKRFSTTQDRNRIFLLKLQKSKEPVYISSFANHGLDALKILFEAPSSSSEQSERRYMEKTLPFDFLEDESGIGIRRISSESMHRLILFYLLRIEIASNILK